MSPEKAVEILKDALLHGEADAATLMEAVRVLVVEFEEDEESDEKLAKLEVSEDEEGEWTDVP